MSRREFRHRLVLTWWHAVTSVVDTIWTSAGERREHVFVVGHQSTKCETVRADLTQALVTTPVIIVSTVWPIRAIPLLPRGQDTSRGSTVSSRGSIVSSRGSTAFGRGCRVPDRGATQKKA